MNKGLRISLIGMGLFFILLGIFLNFQLYTSFATNSPLYKYSYGVIGIGLDVSKVICLILGTFLIKQSNNTLIIAGFIALTFYLILSLISWAAGWGFTLVVNQMYESNAFQKTIQVQASQAMVDDAVAEIKRLSQYADSTTVAKAQSKVDELQTQLDQLWASPARNSLGQRINKTVKSRLGTCPGGSWYHKKYCPQIQRFQSKIMQYETTINNHTAYLAAIKHKNTMVKELGSMNLNGLNPDSYMHPLFVGMSAIFNTSPQLVKYRLLLLTSAMIELLGSLFFVIGLFLKGEAFTIAEMMTMEKQKHKMLSEWGMMEKQRHQLLEQLGVDVKELVNTDFPKLDSTIKTGEEKKDGYIDRNINN